VSISLWQREEREDRRPSSREKGCLTKQCWDYNVFINRDQYTLEKYLSIPTVPMLKGTMSAW
jgi:hypothetical protein